MNLTEIITRVQRSFGDESGAQITTADIIRWANDAQVDIVRKTGLTNQHRETDVVLDDGSYALPDNFMQMIRVTLNGKVLPNRSLHDLDLTSSEIDTAASGTPHAYYIWDNVIYLYPKPSAASVGGLDIWYVSRPATLEDVSDIPEVPIHMHEDIVRYCLARAKELDDDLEGAQVIMGDYETRLGQAVYESTSQPNDSYPAVRALPGDW